MQDWLALTAFIGAVFIAAMTGGIFRPGDWYKNLDKPGFTPPDWLFPVAWAVLYAMIAASGYLFYVAAEPSERVLPLTLYGAQLVTNSAWSAIFFGLRRLDLALVDALLMFALIAATMATFAPVSPLAAALLAPYLVWVGFASALNDTILRRNDLRRRSV